MAGQIVDHAGVGAVGVAAADAHGNAGLDEGHEGKDCVGQQVHPGGEALAGKVGATHLRGKVLADGVREAEPLEASLDLRVCRVGLTHDHARLLVLPMQGQI